MRESEADAQLHVIYLTVCFVKSQTCSRKAFNRTQLNMDIAELQFLESVKCKLLKSESRQPAGGWLFFSPSSFFCTSNCDRWGMWPSAVEFLVCGYGCMCVFGNVLTDALPAQLSPRDLSGAKTGRWGGQERLFTHRGGNRTQAHAPLLLSPSVQPPSCRFPRTSKNTCNLHFLIHGHWLALITREKLFKVQICVCAGAFICTHSPTHCGTIEHGFIKIACTGLKPSQGNELQLQRMKSNYINCLPADGPRSFLSCTGTHLQPYIIAFDLCNRQRHTAGPHLSG